MWQDAILTAGGVVFAAALLPSIFSSDKPAPLTSLLTATVLYLFAAAYFTLDLPFAGLTTAASACLWTALFLQRVGSV